MFSLRSWVIWLVIGQFPLHKKHKTLQEGQKNRSSNQPAQSEAVEVKAQTLTSRRGCRCLQRNCTAPASVAEHPQKVPRRVIQSGDKVKHIKTYLE